MKIPSFGVIVGRFQVHELHDGHLELLNTVRGLHDRVIVFLGTSSSLGTTRNPLDFITRKKMMQSAFPDFTVLALPDKSCDTVWSQELDKRIREIAHVGSVTLYGGRDSFLPHYNGVFLTKELELTHTLTSGEAARAEISGRVVASPDFRAGVIYSCTNQYPKVVPCVDIAIMTDNDALLLAKKPGESGWRFVGGHVDPTDESNEAAAVREAREETGLEIEGIEYVGSARIDDWRWRSERDKVVTSFFVGINNVGVARAKDDIEYVKWFTVADLSCEDFEPTHRPLFLMLVKHLERKRKCYSARIVTSQRTGSNTL